MIKKNRAIIDKIISGIAGPVSKAIGINKKRNEKKDINDL